VTRPDVADCAQCGRRFRKRWPTGGICLSCREWSERVDAAYRRIEIEQGAPMGRVVGGHHKREEATREHL